MADIVLQRNVSALIDVKALSAPLSWTAGGAADSVTDTGATIDREGFVGGGIALSADVDFYYSATLGSGHTLAVSFDLQDSPDGTNFSDFMTEASAVVATGPSGGGVVTGVARMSVPNASIPAGAPGVNLSTARRYLRLLFVPHLSAAGTDTAIVGTLGVFGGFDRLAAPVT
jgi:hypothetical protein